MAKKPIKRQPHFHELYNSGNECVHATDDGMCGKPIAAAKPNGWLCWEHDREVFATAKTVQ